MLHEIARSLFKLCDLRDVAWSDLPTPNLFKFCQSQVVGNFYSQGGKEDAIF